MTTLAREAVQQLINALGVFDFRPLTQGELNSEEQMGASKIGLGPISTDLEPFEMLDDPKWVDLNIVRAHTQALDKGVCTVGHI